MTAARTPEMEWCGACGGTGYGYGYDNPLGPDECPSCEGTGRVPA